MTHQDHRHHQNHQVGRDHRDHRDSQDHWDHRDSRDHWEQREHRDRQDPYRLGPPQTAPAPAPAPGGGPDAVPRGDVLRTLLWTVVVLSAAANMVLSFTGAAVALHLASGVVTVLAVGALVARALRGRR